MTQNIREALATARDCLLLNYEDEAARKCVVMMIEAALASPTEASTADDREELAILGRLRGAARGLCTEDPADYIPRGISAKDAIAAAALITAYAARIEEAVELVSLFHKWMLAPDDDEGREMRLNPRFGPEFQMRVACFLNEGKST